MVFVSTARSSTMYDMLTCHSEAAYSAIFSTFLKSWVREFGGLINRARYLHSVVASRFEGTPLLRLAEFHIFPRIYYAYVSLLRICITNITVGYLVNVY